MADSWVYEPFHDVTWDFNGRSGRGLSSVTKAMYNAAVSENSTLMAIIREWKDNRRATQLLASRAYGWYRANAIPFPGVYLRYYDLNIVRRDGSAHMTVVSIDVSSGGIVYLYRLRR